MIATGAGREFRCLADVIGTGGVSEDGSSGGATANEALRPIRVAVSRLGSGSHLMAYLLALRENWPTQRLSFVVRILRRLCVSIDRH